MTDRTRRVAIDQGGTGNYWQKSGSFVQFNGADFVEFTLPTFFLELGGNGSVTGFVTLWSAGLLSIGSVTQEQIDFMASGQSPIPTAGNPGFPGFFFLFDYTPGVEHTSYSFGIGYADYSAPFDFFTAPGAAFFSFNDSFQIILDENGFAIVKEQSSDSEGANGYYIGSQQFQIAGGEIEINSPDFFTYTGTSGADIMNGSDYKDRFLSSAGADVINGDDGRSDLVSYAPSTAGVSVNLTTGVNSGGDAAGDQLTNIIYVDGSNYADTLIGDGWNNQLRGLGGDDTIAGGSGSDFIEGGPGADILDGGTGSAFDQDYLIYTNSPSGVSISLAAGTASGGDATGDTIQNFEAILGSAFNDVLYGSSTSNYIDGKGGNDTIYGLDGNDEIYGNEGNDVLFGGAGNDRLGGGNGDDFLEGGAGADELGFGGTGTDTLSYAGSPSGITININSGVITGGDATGDAIVGLYPEIIIGSSYDDSITGFFDRLDGGAGNDILTGSNNNNILVGGTGTDTMTGGAGDDAYFVDNAGDRVLEDVDEGSDTVLTTVNYSLGANVERGVIFNSVGTISLYGNELANELTGDDNGNILNGGVGADLMMGNGGDDYYVVDNPGDQAIEIPGGGYDTVFASASFTLNHDLERVVAFDLRSTNSMNFTGNELANELVGNDGANILDGRAGADIMTGNAGNDVYFIDNAGDLVNELAGGGYDTVFTSVNHTLRSNVERGVISGAVGTISLYGNELANELSGDNASNIINGGAGADLMTGYGGNDFYVVDNAADQVIETAGGGFDTVFAQMTYTLDHDVERLIAFDLRSTTAMNLTGNSLANEITGNDGVNVIDGGAGADIMTGNGGNDVFFVDNAGDLINESAGGGYDTVFTSINYLLGPSTGGEIERLAVANRAAAQGLSLRGNNLDNEISGDDGNNIIDGGAGRDILTGYSGSDSFVFSSALGFANADHIADFDPAVDRIALDRAIFTGLATGHLNPAAFNFGAAASDADDRVIYDKATGALYFDPDGTGPMVAQLFATMHEGTALTADNFVII